MSSYDVFNGDADGICSLIQLRLADPKQTTLITGVKRDIALLERTPAGADDEVVVLDISMDKNREALQQVLENGASVIYIDHHFAGDIPQHNKLTAMINTEPETCTSILTDKYLQGKFRKWAVVGAFGDNLSIPAEKLAASLDIGKRLPELKQLGIYINYNGYGSDISDLHFEPAALYDRLVKHADPLSFIDEDRTGFEKLQTGYNQDMALASDTNAYTKNATTAVFMLPDEAWARRVSGVFGNDLANQFPQRGHAIITEIGTDNFLVSIRAPLSNRQGADEICRQFATGGGRKAAAGINQLPVSELENFIRVFSEYYAN
ncbi:MAG: acetyltransferase [Pseudomonadales bacterium]|nr:acetyltransferase [Pseudomonadales bacterium]